MKFLMALLCLAAAAQATPTPSCSASAPTAAFLPHGSNSMTSAGVAAALQVRGGGDLHQPETVEDVDALVLNASSNNQLVVIDFTASWCVFYFRTVRIHLVEECFDSSFDCVS